MTHASALQTLLVFLGVLHSTVSIDRSECPFLCVCVPDETGGVNVTCNVTELLPSSFPKNSKHIVFKNATFDIIPINAFPDLPDLSTIQFIDSSIDTIKACSFAQLKHLDSISFRRSTIQRIQGNSFSNLVNVTSVNFDGTSIGEISSYAFHNITNITLLLIQGSVIQVIHPLAFQDIRHVYKIDIRESTIERFLVNGFSKFSNVGKLSISQKSKIKELQCKSFEAVLTSGGSVEATDTQFTCDCRLAWMWSNINSFQKIIDDSSNKCLNSSEIFSSVDINRMCPDEKSRGVGCPPLLPSPPHRCSSGFDGIDETVSKVAYPTMFPKESENGSGQIYVSTFVMILIVLTLSV